MERDPLSVIDILYEGALDEDAWRRGLLAVADLVSASGLFLMSCNPRTCEVYRYELPRLEPGALEHYQAHWVAQDPRYAGGVGPTARRSADRRYARSSGGDAKDRHLQ